MGWVSLRLPASGLPEAGGVEPGGEKRGSVSLFTPSLLPEPFPDWFFFPLPVAVSAAEGPDGGVSAGGDPKGKNSLSPLPSSCFLSFFLLSFLPAVGEPVLLPEGGMGADPEVS
jgi:hypothetical protein